MNKKTIKKIIIVIAVILLPLIYSVTYLMGFWDPYNNLGNMKVAIVNEDNCSKNCRSTQLIKKLKNSNSFNFVVKDKKNAEKGLLSKKYYATINIPKDFTSSFNNVNNKNRKAAVIRFRPNNKTNYIASQLISNAVLRVEKELDKEVSKQVVKKLSTKLNEVPNQTQKISDGLETIYTGSVALNNGTQKISKGTNTLYTQYQTFDNGINTLNNSMQELKNGTKALKQGIQELSKGSKQLKDGVGQITSQVSETTVNLSNQTNELNESLNTLKQGSNNLATNLNNYNNLSTGILDNMSNYYTNVVAYYETLINNGINLDNNQTSLYLTAKIYTLPANDIINLINNTPALSSNNNCQALKQILTSLIATNSNYGNMTIINILKTNTNALNTGAATLNTGVNTLTTSLTSSLNDITTNMGYLNNGLNELSNGINKLDSGINNTNGLVNGISRIDNGVNQILNGTNTLKNSSTKVSNGINTINTSMSTINNGTNKLSNGVDTAKTGVDEAIKNTKKELENLDGLDEYTKTPVKFKEDAYGKVDDYGTFFSPFFMSLSLWLGGILIIIGLYYDPEKRFSILGKNSSNRSKRLIYYTLIGLAQSLVLPLVLVLLLHFNVTNWFLFYTSCMLIGLSFLSIMLFLTFNFDDVGKFLAVVLLVVQLAACAGTFPLETEPTFFNDISPFMPMTYSVELLRESFVSIDKSLLIKDVIVLLSILIVFSIGIIITGIIKTKKEKVIKS